MSDKSTKCLVADITCQSNTYHVASRDGVILDGITYKNAVTSWDDASLIGNFGTNYQVGSMAIKMTNGEFITDGGWEFDITDVWNNKTCEVKLCDVGTDTTFAGCKPYYKGIIKDFSCDSGELSFSLDAYDNADDTMLPAIVCEDQTALTAAESEFDITDSTQSAGEYIIVLTACTIFCAGELVLLSNNAGGYEYNRIANIAGNNYTMVNPLSYSYDPIDSVASKCKKAFKDIPQASIGKSVPIQCGDLSDVQNGIFAKCIPINERIGKQVILADYLKLKLLSSIGAWEDGSKRYFTGRQRSIVSSEVQGEYEIGTNYNSIYFRVDSSTTLNEDVDDITSGVFSFEVADITKIQWIDEDEMPGGQDAVKYPELLSINIIGIGDELMLLVEKPSGAGAQDIWVERGYNNTTITTHQSGDKIYQCSKFSAKNLLSFTEQFKPIAVTNFYYANCVAGAPPVITVLSINDLHKSGNPSTILNVPSYTPNPEIYWELDRIQADHSYSFANMDLMFRKIEDQFTVVAMFACMRVANDTAVMIYPQTSIGIGVYDPNLQTEFHEDCGDVGSLNANDNLSVLHSMDIFGTVSDYDVPDRESITSACSPSLMNNCHHSCEVTDLTVLNKKIKFVICLNNLGSSYNRHLNFKMYGFCFWIDFFIDFTKTLIAADLKARQYIADTITVCTNGSVGDLVENPVDMICQLLIQELGKATTNFESDNWHTLSDYFKTLANWDTAAQPDFAVPKICFSYGFDDERKKGYEFCEWIASHFNLAIPRNTAGKIDIINLWKNQNDPGTPLEINIEDILQVPGGQRRISIKQTGVDLLYNDVVINYKRNNSTGEYQAVYIVPDNLQLINPIGGSPNTVSQARDTFYGGKKRTLTIESPFIYNEYDAIRKAQWEINDKAEAKFWVEFYIDYELYDNKSLSAQYKIGDVISLVGKCNGIKFANTEKFIIQDIINCDAGRELCIHAKSNDPVTAFFL
jgi:hypothetical protein